MTQTTKKNIGLLKAQVAADAIGGAIALPPISGDWNDYHQQYGRDLTREAILMSTKQNNVVSLAEAKPERSNTESSSTLAQMAASQESGSY